MKRILPVLCFVSLVGFTQTSFAADHHKTHKKIEEKSDSQNEDGFFTVQAFAVDMPDMKLSKDIKDYVMRANLTGAPIDSDFKTDYKKAIIKRSLRSTKNILSDLMAGNKVVLIGMQSIPFTYNANNQIILTKTIQYDYTYPKGVNISKGNTSISKDVSSGKLTLGYILGSRMEDIKGTPYVGTRTILTFTHPKDGKSPIKQLDPKRNDHYGNPNVETQSISRNFKMSSGQTVWFNELQSGKTYDGHHTMLVVGITAVIFDKKPSIK